MEYKYILEISSFLDKSKEGSGTAYNKNLNILKQSLSKVPYSYIFLNYLRYVRPIKKILPWRRGDSIERTPANHMIHALYYRILVKSCFSRRDKYIGLPRPSIFLPDTNVVNDIVTNTIRSIDYLYTMVKPFGFDFPDTLEANGITFKLYELWDPLYVCERLGMGPKPIIRKNIKFMPMNNELYTILYKNYIRQKALL